MNKHIKKVETWDELLTFVESVNPYRNTIVLEGWMNEFVGDRLKIKSLIFSTKPVELLAISDRRLLDMGIDVVATISTRKTKKKQK